MSLQPQAMAKRLLDMMLSGGGLIVSALRAGKPVVTANKELLANVGTELFGTADECNVDLLFEAAVAGGIPLVRVLRESLRGEPIRRVMGIVNGTTNYILTKMTEDGADYGVALGEAQRLGYAERDPTADVEGFDAGAKAAIIATIAFGATVVAGDVYHEGISVTADIDVPVIGMGKLRASPTRTPRPTRSRYACTPRWCRCTTPWRACARATTRCSSRATPSGR